MVDHVSLGLAVGFAGNYGKGIDATSGGTVTYSNASFSFGPRVGANISMGRAFSLYPQFTLGIEHEAYDELAASSETCGPSTSSPWTSSSRCSCTPRRTSSSASGRTSITRSRAR